MKNASLAQVKEVVGKVALPDFVHDIEYELDEDHLGHPCVRISLIIADNAMPKFTTDNEALMREFQPLSELEGKIFDAVIKSDIELWPYTSLVTESSRAKIKSMA